MYADPITLSVTPGYAVVAYRLVDAYAPEGGGEEEWTVVARPEGAVDAGAGAQGWFARDAGVAAMALCGESLPADAFVESLRVTVWRRRADGPWQVSWPSTRSTAEEAEVLAATLEGAASLTRLPDEERNRNYAAGVEEYLRRVDEAVAKSEEKARRAASAAAKWEEGS